MAQQTDVKVMAALLQDIRVPIVHTVERVGTMEHSVAVSREPDKYDDGFDQLVVKFYSQTGVDLDGATLTLTSPELGLLLAIKQIWPNYKSPPPRVAYLRFFYKLPPNVELSVSLT